MQSQIKKLSRIIIRLTGFWLFVAFWWGLTTLAPMQLHNQIVRHDLTYICTALFIFLLIGFWPKSKSSFHLSKKEWIIPLILLLALDAAVIFYFKYISLSFLITTLCLFIISQILDFKRVSELGFLLFLSSLGFVITQFVMNLFRGRPEAGASFFARQISALLNLFGKKSDALSGVIFFQGKKIACDLIKIGFFPWMAFTLSFMALIILIKGNFIKKIFAAAVGLFVHYLYLLARFSIISAFLPNIMLAGPNPFNLFYWRILLLSFFPLILLWFILLYEFRLTESDIIIPSLSSVKSGQKNFLILSIFMITILLLTISYCFQGFTTHRKIHCVIDEVHSDWESSLIDFNQDIFGPLAENSYHSFLDYLRHFYPVTVLTDKISLAPPLKGVKIFHAEAITSSLLHKLNNQHPASQVVLILKCITTPFSPEEIEDIKDFVFKGGSVFLVGDHTDVYFMNKNLNELSKFFGIRFKQNSVYFVDGGWAITDYSYYIHHPATHYLKKFIWATGDSLKLDPPAFPLIYSSHVCFADEVNYFYDNFFGNTKIDAEEIFGSFCLMAGAQYGQGKVIAFTDSTCFNNYLMFTVGRRDFIAGVFGWLADKGRLNPFPWLTLIGFISLLILFYKKRPAIKTILHLVITAALIGWITGYLFSLTLNCLIYPEQKPIHPLPPRVILDAVHGPRHCLSFGNSEWFLSPASYDNLLYNIGRIDLFPQVLYKGSITRETLDKISCLIIASPTKNFCQKEKNTIEYYIRDGGALFLIEGANPDSTINQIANLFDIHIRPYPYRNTIKKMKETYLINNKDGLDLNPAWIDGGNVLFEYNNMPIVTFKRIEKGLIVVLGDSGLFMRKNFNVLGKELTALQCNVIKALINKDEMLLKSIDWNYLEKTQ